MTETSENLTATSENLIEIPDPVKMREIATLNMRKKIYEDIKERANDGNRKLKILWWEMGGFSADEITDILKKDISSGYVIGRKYCVGKPIITIKW